MHVDTIRCTLTAGRMQVGQGMAKGARGDYGEETTMEGGPAKGARGDPTEGIMVSLPAFVEKRQSRIMENGKARTLTA